MQDSHASPRLRPPRNPVERRAVTWWATQAALWWGGIVVVLAVAAAVIGPARFWLLLAAAVTAVVCLVDALVVSRVRFRVHRWEVTDDAVYARTGWFMQEWRVAPMSRIQTVDTKRGPLEQRFGLSTVTVTTASAHGAIKIPGLDHRMADDLVQTLTAITQATPGDAT
ncbi:MULTISPECIES: PH domain-containing protein [Actinokineospora]|nr:MULTISPECIES: PH domain-containing protein [Actinokineospora]UVS77776.1 Bacterial membrane flanked domain protein [Actinokineospora sp. UTMC 2448]